MYVFIVYLFIVQPILCKDVPAERKKKKHIETTTVILMVSTTNVITNITNHQFLTIKTIIIWFSVVCFGTYSTRI